MVSDVLDMAQIESGRSELRPLPHRMSELLTSTKHLFAQDMKKKDIDFSVEWDIQDDVVFVDRLRFEQIELNLLGNAMKYTPAGGKITYTVSQISEVKDGYAVYEGRITDTGIGMSKEFVGRVFEAFEREKSSTEDKKKGIGLGLTITKKLLDQMGGTICCESEPGAGSTFRYTMTLKVGEEADIKNPEDAPGPEAFSFKGKRILLVEDNEMNREIAMEILCEFGFTVDTAEDGVIAVDKMMKSAPGEYDLILMDIQMPNMDGYKATKLIRQLNNPYQAQIPIVALTANAFEKDRQDAFEAGMNYHMAKPIDVANLMETINHILENK